MNEFANWIEAHPLLFTALIWPIVSAVVTWITKPRTAEEMAALSPRVAAFLRLVRKVGIDAPGALDALYQLFTGKPRPRPPTSTGLRLVSGAVLALAITGSVMACRATLPPEERQQIIDTAATLARCQEEGRKADAGDHIAVYEACKKDGGL